MEYGICLRGSLLFGLTEGLVYKIMDTYVDSCGYIDDRGMLDHCYVNRFRIIPEEVLESPLFKAVYGEPNGEEKE